MLPREQVIQTINKSTKLEWCYHTNENHYAAVVLSVMFCLLRFLHPGKAILHMETTVIGGVEGKRYGLAKAYECSEQVERSMATPVLQYLLS